MLITTNLAFADWPLVFGDAKMTTANLFELRWFESALGVGVGEIIAGEGGALGDESRLDGVNHPASTT